MTNGPNKVVQSSHAVIERKLLMALSDESKVAIIADKEDLDLLIDALGETDKDDVRAQFFYAGLKQLRRETFGEN